MKAKELFVFLAAKEKLCLFLPPFNDREIAFLCSVVLLEDAAQWPSIGLH